MGRCVVLVGPMGSGKSTVGRALAQRLGVDHLDTDAMVEEAAGATIPAVFSSEGESAFRAHEHAALRRALELPDAVISTGGGIVAAEANRVLLREAGPVVVWLDAALDTLVGRVGDGADRPLLQGDARAALAGKVAERAAAYAEVADLRVDTTSRTVEACVAEIVAALGREIPA